MKERFEGYIYDEEKSELVDSCDGVFSEEMFRRFDRDVDEVLRGFSGAYIFEVVLFDSGVSCNEGIGV